MTWTPQIIYSVQPSLWDKKCLSWGQNPRWGKRLYPEHTSFFFNTGQPQGDWLVFPPELVTGFLAGSPWPFFVLFFCVFLSISCTKKVVKREFCETDFKVWNTLSILKKSPLFKLSTKKGYFCVLGMLGRKICPIKVTGQKWLFGRLPPLPGRVQPRP